MLDETRFPTFANQVELFKYIWETRCDGYGRHYSEISGKPLNYDFGYAMFHVFSHVISKGAGPRLKLWPINIVLKTLDEHQIWETRRWTVIDNPLWTWVFVLREQLLPLKDRRNFEQ